MARWDQTKWDYPGFPTPKNCGINQQNIPKGIFVTPISFLTIPAALVFFRDNGEATPGLRFASQSITGMDWDEILGKTYLAGVLLVFQPLLQGLEEIQGMVFLQISWMWWGHSQALQRGMDRC